MANFNGIYNVPNFYNQQQPMFPQPNGNIYVISNSLEVANVPAGAGITAALCSSESLLYLKTVQNGVPTFLAYKLTPYTESPKMQPQEDETEKRLLAIEKQLASIISALGGKKNDIRLSVTLQPESKIHSTLIHSPVYQSCKRLCQQMILQTFFRI